MQSKQVKSEPKGIGYAELCHAYTERLCGDEPSLTGWLGREFAERLEVGEKITGTVPSGAEARRIAFLATLYVLNECAGLLQGAMQEFERTFLKRIEHENPRRNTGRRPHDARA